MLTLIQNANRNTNYCINNIVCTWSWKRIFTLQSVIYGPSWYRE